MPWYTIHHSTNTANADACIQDFFTAITMQCFCNANRSQSMLTTIQLGVSTVFSTAHERDSFHSLLTRFLWICAAILQYNSNLCSFQAVNCGQLCLWRSPDCQYIAVNKVSKPRHSSRTKLCIELSLVHIRDNTEFYLHCKFQTLPFSVRRKNGVTDRLNDRQRDYSMPRGSAHRGIKMHHWCGLCLGGC